MQTRCDTREAPALGGGVFAWLAVSPYDSRSAVSYLPCSRRRQASRRSPVPAVGDGGHSVSRLCAGSASPSAWCSTPPSRTVA
jgi:hypothetical protein